MELTRTEEKAGHGARGHKLLKDKRDELMRQFLDLVRENKELREKVESGIAEPTAVLRWPVPAMSDEAVRVAFMSPKQEVSLNVRHANVMSVDVPVYTSRPVRRQQ
jgi:V/A-type H+-transporting ATPase subunit D